MKKVLVFLISVFAAVTVLTASAFADFKDVTEKHWAYENVSKMVSYGIVNGYNDGTFRPDNGVTRGEWAKLLTSTAWVPEYENYRTVLENCALDVDPDEWYASYLVSLMPYFDFDEAVEADGKIFVEFLPKQPATRLEITKSIIIQKGFDVSEPDYTLVTSFKDYAEIPEDDLKYIAVAVEKGIINGFTDRTFRPHANVNRAEAVTILYRAYLKKDEPEEAEEVKPYTISKLVSAEITENASIMATLDDKRNLYYIDVSDNCVYRVSLDDRKKVLYYDPSKLTVENTVYDEYGEELGLKKLSAFKCRQVYYDTERDMLLLNGIYTNIVEPGKAADKNGEVVYIYDISDNRNASVYASLESWDFTDLPSVQAVFDDTHFIAYDRSFYKIETETSKMEAKFDSGSCEAEECVVFQIYNNNIFYFSFHKGSISENHSSYIYKYNYTEDDFKFAVNSDSSIRFSALGMKNGYYYWYSKEKKMYKYNLKNNSVDELDITLDSEYFENKDLTAINALDTYFYVVDDDTFIFYDNSMKAFRILEKTLVPEAEVVVPYFVGADYYKNYEKASVNKPVETKSEYDGYWSHISSFESFNITLYYHDDKVDLEGNYDIYDIGEGAFNGTVSVKNGVSKHIEFQFTDKNDNVLLWSVLPQKAYINDRVENYVLCTLKSVNGVEENLAMRCYNEQNKKYLMGIDTVNVYASEAGETYTTSNTDASYGGHVIDLTLKGDFLDVKYTYLQGYPNHRVADFTKTVDLSKITGYVIEIPFEEDGWGHSGVLELKFNEGNNTLIWASIKNVVSREQYPLCGVSEFESLEFWPNSEIWDDVASISW